MPGTHYFLGVSKSVLGSEVRVVRTELWVPWLFSNLKAPGGGALGLATVLVRHAICTPTHTHAQQQSKHIKKIILFICFAGSCAGVFVAAGAFL